jgi:hypothetical protein
MNNYKLKNYIIDDDSDEDNLPNFNQDVDKESKDIIKESKDIIKESKDIIKGSKDIIKGSKDIIKGSKDIIKESKDIIKEPKNIINDEYIFDSNLSENNSENYEDDCEYIEETDTSENN